MLARKAIGVTVESNALGAQSRTRRKKKSKTTIWARSPELEQALLIVFGLVVFVMVSMVLQMSISKSGYEIVKLQNNVVQLTKDNETLSVEVASLKSPTRIQKIAQDTLGMVLPDSFVYNGKSTTGERSVQTTQHIVD